MFIKPERLVYLILVEVPMINDLKGSALPWAYPGRTPVCAILLLDADFPSATPPILDNGSIMNSKGVPP
jgi:hypothetical protein